jgi:hypothetical protein
MAGGSVKTEQTASGEAPFYLSLAENEVMVGSLHFAKNGGLPVSGNVIWVKTGPDEHERNLDLAPSAD